MLFPVTFRVKAPVTRRPPHRPGRADVPPPVPRKPTACAQGEPNWRHPVWRLTLLALARLDVGNDPGGRQRSWLPEGTRTLPPVYVALVATPAQPVVPRTLRRLADHFPPLEGAPATSVWVGASPLHSSRPRLLFERGMARFTTPWPYLSHKPT
jgi:hypothetical protein